MKLLLAKSHEKHDAGVTYDLINFDADPRSPASRENTIPRPCGTRSLRCCRRSLQGISVNVYAPSLRPFLDRPDAVPQPEAD